MFLEIFRKFVNFTEKHLYWNLFLIKLQVKRLKHRCFSVEFTKFLKTYERLLLKPVVSHGVYFVISYTLAQIDKCLIWHQRKHLLSLSLISIRPFTEFLNLRGSLICVLPDSGIKTEILNYSASFDSITQPDTS